MDVFEARRSMDCELMKWDQLLHDLHDSNRKDLFKKVLDSFDELKAEFPPDNEHSEVYEGSIIKRDDWPFKDTFKGYRLYERKYMGAIVYPVAYGCNECNKIILGAPAIGEIKGGVHGVRYTCNNCQKCMYENIMGHGGCFGGDDDFDNDF